MINAHIIGWGKYLPSKVITNAELAQTAGIDAEWVTNRTGIEQRHIADPKQASADMAAQAAHAALQVADLSPSQLDLIVVATNTPDYWFPATACLVQDALGADHAGAFDLAAGCSGFLYALVTAEQFIRGGAYRNILVVGVETVSRIIDWKNSICAYFGDGAGAVVLTASDQPGGLLGFALSSDGSGGDLLKLPGGGTRYGITQEVIDQGLQYGQMDGRALYRYGLRAMSWLAQRALRQARLEIKDIDLFIPHQTNATLIRQVAERLHVPSDKTLVNVARYANLSSAAIPVSLCDAIEQKRIVPSNHVLLTAFGGGLTSAAVVWQWSQPLPKRPASVVRRFWHAVWDAQAAFRSRFFRLEHQLDTIAPVDEGEIEETQVPSPTKGEGG
ncbi:MAG: ketoacyl-ACP synthase III [Chloroflexi bacterium]|nr:ketoacyl-ACP synthase III [Chloroflexota bacterium]